MNEVIIKEKPLTLEELMSKQYREGMRCEVCQESHLEGTVLCVCICHKDYEK